MCSLFWFHTTAAFPPPNTAAFSSSSSFVLQTVRSGLMVSSTDIRALRNHLALIWIRLGVTAPSICPPGSSPGAERQMERGTPFLHHLFPSA